MKKQNSKHNPHHEVQIREVTIKKIANLAIDHDTAKSLYESEEFKKLMLKRFGKDNGALTTAEKRYIRNIVLELYKGTSVADIASYVRALVKTNARPATELDLEKPLVESDPVVVVVAPTTQPNFVLIGTHPDESKTQHVYHAQGNGQKENISSKPDDPNFRMVANDLPDISNKSGSPAVIDVIDADFEEVAADTTDTTAKKKRNNEPKLINKALNIWSAPEKGANIVRIDGVYWTRDNVSKDPDVKVSGVGMRLKYNLWPNGESEQIGRAHV